MYKNSSAKYKRKHDPRIPPRFAISGDTLKAWDLANRNPVRKHEFISYMNEYWNDISSSKVHHTLKETEEAYNSFMRALVKFVLEDEIPVRLEQLGVIQVSTKNSYVKPLIYKRGVGPDSPHDIRNAVIAPKRVVTLRNAHIYPIDKDGNQIHTEESVIFLEKEDKTNGS